MMEYEDTPDTLVVGGFTFFKIGRDAKFGAVYSIPLGVDGVSLAHEGEPCFVIRGRDLAAVNGIGYYFDEADEMGSQFRVTVIEQVLSTVKDWQIANQDKVHVAD